MKIMMVEGRYKGEIDMSNLDADILPKKIGLATTVQFLDYVDEIKQFLRNNGRNMKASFLAVIKALQKK